MSTSPAPTPDGLVRAARPGHDTRVNRCREVACRAPIVLVLVVPTKLTKGVERKRVPLDLWFDPEGAIPASHGLSSGRNTCRPLTRDDRLRDGEHPALVHFATCAARTSRSTP